MSNGDVLRFDEWPATDQALWFAALVPAETVLDDRKPASHWRPLTRKTEMRCYGKWLGWLRNRGEADESRPESRLTTERLEAYLHQIQATLRSWTVKRYVEGLLRTLSVLAPQADLGILRRAIARLPQAAAEPERRMRLRDSSELLALGLQLMEKAERGEKLRRRTPADHYRDGLQIALLACCPLRNGNFGRIEIDNHLVRKGEAWTLRFQPTVVKNQRTIEMSFPDHLVVYLERYLSLYRRQLCADQYTGPALWVSNQSTAQTLGVTAKWICYWTQKEFGAPISPHLVRNCAATTLALHAPELITIAPALLTNSHKTCQGHYNQAGMLSAGKKYRSILDEFRVTRAKTGRRRRT